MTYILLFLQMLSSHPWGSDSDRRICHRGCIPVRFFGFAQNDKSSASAGMTKRREQEGQTLIKY